MTTELLNPPKNKTKQKTTQFKSVSQEHYTQPQISFTHHGFPEQFSVWFLFYFPFLFLLNTLYLVLLKKEMLIQQTHWVFFQLMK